MAVNCGREVRFAPVLTKPLVLFDRRILPRCVDPGSRRSTYT